MLRRLVSFLNRFSEYAHDTGTIVFLPLMIFLITANVALRYLFNAPLRWGDEMEGLLLFLVLFLSITYTWDLKKHIRMEIVYVHFKGPLRSFADIVTGLTGIVFFGLMGAAAVKDIPYMIRTFETGAELPFPLWPFRVVMAVICFVFVLKLVIYTLVGRKEEEKEGVQIEREGVVIQKEVK